MYFPAIIILFICALTSKMIEQSSSKNSTPNTRNKRKMRAYLISSTCNNWTTMIFRLLIIIGLCVQLTIAANNDPLCTSNTDTMDRAATTTPEQTTSDSSSATATHLAYCHLSGVGANFNGFDKYAQRKRSGGSVHKWSRKMLNACAVKGCKQKGEQHTESWMIEGVYELADHAAG